VEAGGGNFWRPLAFYAFEAWGVLSPRRAVKTGSVVKRNFEQTADGDENAYSHVGTPQCRIAKAGSPDYPRATQNTIVA